MLWSLTVLVMAIFGLSFQSQSTQPTYLALGDSYTIGESVPRDLRWPVQLAKRFNDSGIEMGKPRIIATTGWTTDELQRAIDKAEITETYDMVSLLIGVNNQYRGYPFAQYEEEFEALLDEAIARADGQANRVFVVSIPDYGVTPFGQQKDPERIDRELQRYNAKAEKIAKDKDVLFINITDISRQALSDPSLVADDKLHPSGKMYTAWVDRIFPQVKAFIK